MTPQPPPEESREPDSGPAADTPPISPFAVLRALFLAGDSLLTQAALHGQLVRIEWTEQKKRLLQMLACILIGFVGLLCLLLFAGALALAFSWNTEYRIPVALTMVVVYGLVATLAWFRFRALSARSSQAFEATRDELAADLELLRSRM